MPEAKPPEFLARALEVEPPHANGGVTSRCHSARSYTRHFLYSLAPMRSMPRLI